MESLSILIAGALVGLFGFLLWRGQTRSALRKSARVEGRDSLETERAWAEYSKEFGISRELVSEVVPLVATAAEVDASKLRPTDRFDKELAEEKGWQFDSGLNEIRWYLEKVARRKLSDVELAELRTVGDVIQFVENRREKLAP